MGFLAADVPSRKRRLNATLRRLFVFDSVVQALRKSAGGELEDSVVLGELALLFPHERPPRLLATIVSWARYAALFKYDSSRRVFHGLQEPPAESGSGAPPLPPGRPAEGPGRLRRDSGESGPRGLWGERPMVRGAGPGFIRRVRPNEPSGKGAAPEDGGSRGVFVGIHSEKERTWMGTVILVVLVLLLVGALPTWPHSRGWGYFPSGGLGLVVIILLVMLLTGRM